MDPSTLTEHALRYVIRDCREAIAAMPDNPKADTYRDQIAAAAQELERRTPLYLTAAKIGELRRLFPTYARLRLDPMAAQVDAGGTLYRGDRDQIAELSELANVAAIVAQGRESVLGR